MWQKSARGKASSGFLHERLRVFALWRSTCKKAKSAQAENNPSHDGVTFSGTGLLDCRDEKKVFLNASVHFLLLPWMRRRPRIRGSNFWLLFTVAKKLHGSVFEDSGSVTASRSGALMAH